MELIYNAYNITLKIIEYEFKNGDNIYDKNWLIVKVIYNKGNKTIKQFPALLTWEIDKIIQWLYKVKNNKKVKNLSFIENEIEFKYQNSRIYIELCFDLSIKDECINALLNTDKNNIDDIIFEFKKYKKDFPKR